ncbi:hypothetical protein E2C01_012843 [Portunus trituberculatus]|uniref:Uncharacterized protein n=1 Tax=Portunus trituberculatus TaxID=210409 RepID=A0A5B7DEP1_PORTR|nr:hypothetical protein [Portunus trituberculatus]
MIPVVWLAGRLAKQTWDALHNTRGTLFPQPHASSECEEEVPGMPEHLLQQQPFHSRVTPST